MTAFPKTTCRNCSARISSASRTCPWCKHDPQAAPPGPYSIGSDHWPGLAKLSEECGEVVQVIGKIIAAGGEDRHWDGSDLRQRLEDEIADVLAAAQFVADHGGLDAARMAARTADKLALFARWHREHADGSTGAG